MNSYKQEVNIIENNPDKNKIEKANQNINIDITNKKTIQNNIKLNLEHISKYINIINNNLELNLNPIKNKNYDKNFFIDIPVIGDGNCLYL